MDETSAGLIDGAGGVRPPLQGSGQLRDHHANVADHAPIRRARGIFADFFGGDVDVDEFDVGAPFGRGAEMEDPVQAGAEDQYHICVLESGAPRAGGVERVRVGQDAFAHWGWEEGDLGLVDEGTDGFLGLGVGCSFANDEQRARGGLEQCGDFEELCRVCARFGRIGGRQESGKL